jgi:hypothetical protein
MMVSSTHHNSTLNRPPSLVCMMKVVAICPSDDVAYNMHVTLQR